MMRMDVNFVLPLKNEREVFTFTNSVIFWWPSQGQGTSSLNLCLRNYGFEIAVTYVKLSSNYLLSATALTSQ